MQRSKHKLVWRSLWHHEYDLLTSYKVYTDINVFPFTRFKQNIWSRMCRYRKMYLPPNRKDKLIIQWIIDTALSCACYNIENKMKYIKVKLNHLRISILTTKVVQEKTSPNKSVVTESMELFTDLWHC